MTQRPIRTGPGATVPLSPRRLPTGSGITLLPSSHPSTSSNPILKPIDTSAGMLRVEVMSAKNLPPAILGSLLKWTPSYSNPFVVLKLHREEFITTIKEKTLNPVWKEMGELHVPLPSEQELVQTSGSLDGTGVHKTTKTHHIRHEFHPCMPEILVQVYHRHDSTATDLSSSSSTSQTQGHVRRLSDDKLIGSVIVPLLPCLLSSGSSHRAWYSLVASEESSSTNPTTSIDAGQIQLAMHYDVGGMEPQKGDIVRLTGFGGMDYYSKLLTVNTRLEVMDTFQDQVFAQCKSVEGWTLSFEFHRNLVHVVRRPSMLRDASTQLQGQITRVRHSPIIMRAQNVWMTVPENQRQHALRLYRLALFSGGVAANVMTECVQKASTDGFVAALQTCRESGSVALEQITTEFIEKYWTMQQDGVHKSNGIDEQMEYHLGGGPLRGRGRIVRGFGGVVDGEEEEEEKATEDDFDDAFEQEEEDVEQEEQEGHVENDTKDVNKTVFTEDVAQCPEQLICPITGCPMVDPVVAADGHTYEREAILYWFSTNTKSPMTGMQIPTTQVFPNFTLRKLSEEFQQSYQKQRSIRQ